METRKIVINSCYGGFGLSEKAIMRFAELEGRKIYADKSDKFLIRYYTSESMDEESYFSERDIERDNPNLVKVVEELGSDANDTHADLTIVSIPADVDWEIEEYDGEEWVSEKHRIWR